MKIKVSKVMVKELNKHARNLEFIYRECDIDTYRTCVDCDIFANDVDWDMDSGKMKFIQVTYPCVWYALPKYLTTKELSKMFKSDDTIESYCKRVVNEMQI